MTTITAPMNLQTLAPAESQEQAVIQRVLSGKKNEFQDLVELYQDRIYSLIMRQVGDQALANDLAQETFIKAYQHLKSFRFQARFSTWLTRIALNVASSYFSSRQFRERQKSYSLEQINIPEPITTLDDNEHFRTRAQLEELHLAIGTLKPKFREVLVLCSLENKRYEDAAEILNIPIGTVCSRMNTALKQLRERLCDQNVYNGRRSS